MIRQHLMVDGDRTAKGEDDEPADSPPHADVAATLVPPPRCQAEASRHLLDQAIPVVRKTLRGKFKTSLDPADGRPGNEEALDVYGEVMLALWQALAGADPADPIRDIAAYARTATRNVYAEHLRRKYPNRASFRGRLRRFLAAESRAPNPKCRLCEDASKDWWCSLGAATEADPPVMPGGISALERDPSKFDLARLGAKPASSLDAGDFRELVTTIVQAAGGRLRFDDLVAAAVSILQVEEAPCLPRDAAEGGKDDNFGSGDAGGEESLGKLVETRDALRRVWSGVSALERRHRLPFLLNPPMGSDIDVFVEHGIATIRAIGDALALDDEDYALLSRTFHLDELKDGAIAGRVAPLERFYQLWNNLPLPDALIAQLLHLDRQQVINLRQQACVLLNRRITGASRKQP
jgi:DNA-directed RNA polymerase specialized sigma24 family protein